MKSAESKCIVNTFGFLTVPDVLSPPEVSKLLSTLGEVATAGVRGMLRIPAVAQIARSEKFLDLARPHLAADVRPVRAIYFDKSADSNWVVSWHQDLTVAVRAQAVMNGFGPWTDKAAIS